MVYRDLFASEYSYFIFSSIKVYVFRYHMINYYNSSMCTLYEKSFFFIILFYFILFFSYYFSFFINDQFENNTNKTRFLHKLGIWYKEKKKNDL